MNDTAALWSKEQCQEAYDELMIKIALSSYAKIDGQDSLDENERLKTLSQFTATPEAQSKIRHTVNKEFSRQSLRETARGVYRVTSKVAVVFLVFAIMFSGTMMASAEFRSAIYKLIFTHEQRYTLVEIDSDTDLEFVDSEVYTWDHAFAPTVMPPGYVASDVLGAGVIHVVIYKNDHGEKISFAQDNGTADSGTLQVDTENAQLVQTILINDSEGLLVSKDGLNTIAWRIGNSILTLESNKETETLIAIAKGIMLLN